MPKNRKIPRWILDEDWAIDTDPYNWILYQRSGKQWKAKGYYPSLDQLFESLLRKVSRTERHGDDLMQHIEGCYERVTVVSERFSELLKREVWVGLKRPSKEAM